MTHFLLGPNKTSTMSVWVKKASDVGMNSDNLYLGIGWIHSKTNTYNSKAWIEKGTIDDEPVTFIIMMEKEDPFERTNINIDLPVLIHEFIHYFDYERGYSRHIQNMDRKDKSHVINDEEGYYYNPLEFNAYYKQGLHLILNKLIVDANSNVDVSDISYKEFKNKYCDLFSKYWFPRLNEKSKRKFEKRFYLFYQLVKNKWSNIDYVKDRIS